MAGILSKALMQLHEERSVSAMRAEEAEAQLALATELGRQEERRSAQQLVSEARGTLSAYVDVHERGAAHVKSTERAMLASALAEQRRGLEQELRESRMITESEQAELRHAQEARHKKELQTYIDERDVAVRVKEEVQARVDELLRQQESTRDGRIQQYMQKAGRRLAQAGLTRGWSSWVEFYEEYLYRKELIRDTQGMFFHIMPTVRTAFSKWQHERQKAHEARDAEAAQRKNQSEEQLSDDVLRLEEDLERQKGEYEGKLAEARAEVGSLQQQMAEQKAQFEEATAFMQAREEEEKAQRMERLLQHAGNLLKHQGLMRGWVKWAGDYRAYASEQRKMKLFREAQMRLAKAGLARPFFHWRGLSEVSHPNLAAPDSLRIACAAHH